MFEFLFETLPESALACRRLYDVRTGGYHLPLREHNVALRLAEVDLCRSRHPDVVYDCVETPVADLLYSLVVNTRSRWILETGTSRGFSTSHLAAGARFVGGDSARVLTIDRAPAPNPFFAGPGVGESVAALRADSLAIDLRPLTAGGAKFDFMFFDSLHTYAHLSGELVRFLPHLKAGGLFALHDTMVYDDLGLVVAGLAASGLVEAVSLPTHRSHGENSRPPGVTLFRKVGRIDAGDLVFPDLAGIVDGERQSIERPERVVRRTGALFIDPRYAMSGLHRHGPRDDSSPPLLECMEALRERETPSCGSLNSRIDAFVGARSSTAARPSPTLHRHATVDPVARTAQDEWWRRFGALEHRLYRLLPEPFGPKSQRRIIAKMVECGAGAAAVVHFVCGTGCGPSVLQMALGAAGASVQQVPVDRWREGHDDLPAADVYLLHGILCYLSSTEIEALIARLKKAAPTGARIVVVEPVCYPGHRPDALDAAIVKSIAALADTPVRAARRNAIDDSPGTLETRALLAKRWWGELPSGPTPLQRPFVDDELARCLARDFEIRSNEVVQAVIGHELGRELLLLDDEASPLAHRLAAELVPALDELEAALLARKPLPDVSWYLSMLVAVA